MASLIIIINSIINIDVIINIIIIIIIIIISAKVEGLIEGYQYSFRVKAVNLGSTGLWNYSPPSEPSATMTAKTRFTAAAFRQPGMYDIEVRAGKTFR